MYGDVFDGNFWEIMTEPYMILGPVFPLLIGGGAMLMLYIALDDLAPVAVVGIFLGPLMFATLPPEATAGAVLVVAIGLGAAVFRMYEASSI